MHMQHHTWTTEDFAAIVKGQAPFPGSQKGFLISEVFKQAAEHLAHDFSDYNRLYPKLKEK